MPKTSPLTPYFTLICACGLLFATAAQGQLAGSAKSRFVFKDADGRTDSAEVVTKYAPRKIVHPFSKMDGSVDPKLRQAASIAEERAHAHSREQCWHYVKEALVASGASKGAGHVEIRTKSGFASDFRSKIPSPRPLIGVYTKL